VVHVTHDGTVTAPVGAATIARAASSATAGNAGSRYVASFEPAMVSSTTSARSQLHTSFSAASASRKGRLSAANSHGQVPPTSTGT
jgi:hypothetical protein